jgi:Tol biopolymer transport system component
MRNYNLRWLLRGYAPLGKVSLKVLAAALAVAALAAAGADAHQALAPEPGASDFAPQVSPDGKRVLFLRVGITKSHLARAMSLYSVGIDGRHVRALTRGSVVTGANLEQGHYDAVTGADWSPDGTKVVYAHEHVRDRGDDLKDDLVVADADGTNARTILATEPPLFIHADSPSWSSRNEIAFADFTRFWSIRPDGSGLTQVGDAYEDKWTPVWSPDGTEIAYVGGRGIAVMRPDGSLVSVAFGGKLNEGSPAWAPDGRQLAFSAEAHGPEADIYTVNRDGGGERRLTTSAAADVMPAWTPDGKSIIFASDRGRAQFQFDLWIMRADGNHQRRLIPSKPWHAWNGRRCTIAGSSGPDDIDGTPRADILCAGAGADVIDARDNRRDFVDGGPGRDRAQIDRGLDVVRGVEKILS